MIGVNLSCCTFRNVCHTIAKLDKQERETKGWEFNNYRPAKKEEKFKQACCIP